jgi:hypothetical protein
VTKESTTFGLNPEKMAKLFRIGADEDDCEKEISAEQKKAEVLLDRLAEPLLLDPSVVRLLPVIPSLLSNALDLCNGEPIGDLLQDPEVEISVLKKIKSYNNKLSKRSKSEAERDTAIVLYYGAIASALVFHNKKISKFSNKNLEAAFSSLIGKPWVTPGLVTLFSRARQMCRTSSKKQHGSDTERQCELNDSGD